MASHQEYVQLAQDAMEMDDVAENHQEKTVTDCQLSTHADPLKEKKHDDSGKVLHQREEHVGGEADQVANIEEPKITTFVDYLKSPIVRLIIGAPHDQMELSAHLQLLQTSPWFAKALSRLEVSSQNGVHVVHLPDDDFQAVGSFLEYLYTKEYNPRLVPSASGRPEEMKLEGITEMDEEGDQLLQHAKVYVLAQKLELSDLKTLAHAKIHRIDSTAKGELRYAKYVYENTSKEDKVIRQPIASFWAHRSHVLRHEAESDFQSMVIEFPQFGYDILSIVLDQKEKGKEHHPKKVGESMEVAPTSNTKTAKNNRKRPRMSIVG